MRDCCINHCQLQLSAHQRRGCHSHPECAPVRRRYDSSWTNNGQNSAEPFVSQLSHHDEKIIPNADLRRASCSAWGTPASAFPVTLLVPADLHGVRVGLQGFPDEGQDPGGSRPPSLCLALLPRIQAPFLFGGTIPHGVLGDSGRHFEGLQSSLVSASCQCSSMPFLSCLCLPAPASTA